MVTTKVLHREWLTESRRVAHTRTTSRANIRHSDDDVWVCVNKDSKYYHATSTYKQFYTHAVTYGDKNVVNGI